MTKQHKYDVLVGSGSTDTFISEKVHRKVMTANAAITRINNEASVDIHWCLSGSFFMSDEEIIAQPNVNGKTASESLMLRKAKIESVKGKFCHYLYVNTDKANNDVKSELDKLEICYDNLTVFSRRQRSFKLLTGMYLKHAQIRFEMNNKVSPYRYVRSLITANIPSSVKPSTGACAALYAADKNNDTLLCDGMTFSATERFAYFSGFKYQHLATSHLLDLQYLQSIYKRVNY